MFEDESRGGSASGVAAGDARWQAWFDAAPWAKLRAAAADGAASSSPPSRGAAAARHGRGLGGAGSRAVATAYPYNTGCLCSNMEDSDTSKRHCSSG